MASGYCRCPCLPVCLCVSVCVCVHQPGACPPHKSSRIQARTTKFGQNVQNNLDKVPFVLGGDLPWSSMSNLTWKAKFTPFEFVYIITHHLFKLEPSNLDKRCKLSCLWSLSFWGAIDSYLCYTHNRHPICTLSPTVAAQWFYCSISPSRHHELYLSYAHRAVLARAQLQSI